MLLLDIQPTPSDSLVTRLAIDRAFTVTKQSELALRLSRNGQTVTLTHSTG